MSRQREEYVRPVVKGITPNQRDYLNKIKSNTIIIAIGPAGTGKSYVSVASAAEALYNHSIKKVIVTRPAVEAGERLGFLPGDLDDKFSPYLVPVKEIFEKMLGVPSTEKYIRGGFIEAVPLAYLRGRTFDDCWVILDEAQNTTPEQMKMFVTRLGQNAKLMINGDTTQRDIYKACGLSAAISKLNGLAGIAIAELDSDDIVRSELVKGILHRWP